MSSFIEANKAQFKSVVEHFVKDISSLRTGSVSPGLFEEIPVEAYESIMEMKGLASINLQDARTVIIQPWDKGLLQSIEKAIRSAELGVSPAVDGDVIRVVMPQMTEETRAKIVKIMKEKLEEARVGMRKVRESLRDEVNKLEKDKDISEDEKFKMLEEIDEATKEFTADVDTKGKKKEEEIMTV
ncbi:MAG: ribosome recycling factor [Patescibacteria group bacterium]